MHRLLYWPLSVAVGVLVAVETRQMAGQYFPAVWAGFLWGAALFLLGRSSRAAERTEPGTGDVSIARQAAWLGAFVVLMWKAMSIAMETVPSGADAAVAVVVFGAGMIGLAIGSGLTVRYPAGGD